MSLISKMENGAPTEKKCGYLLKNSTAGIYRKRFFEINGDYLTYFKTEKRRKLLEAISIPSASNIRLIDRYSNGSKQLSPTNGSRTILIDMRDRQYELMADTVEDAELWLKELVSIRDAELTSNQLEKSIRQQWSFTSSGKATRIDLPLLNFAPRDSNPVTLDNEATNCTSDSLVSHSEKGKNDDIHAPISSSCCLCLPVNFGCRYRSLPNTPNSFI